MPLFFHLKNGDETSSEAAECSSQDDAHNTLCSDCHTVCDQYNKIQKHQVAGSVPVVRAAASKTINSRELAVQRGSRRDNVEIITCAIIGLGTTGTEGRCCGASWC